jgi:integrase
MEATTREGHTYSIYRHIMPWFGPMRMNQIMPADVREWVTHLTNSKIGPSNLRTLKSILSAVFTTALNDQVTFVHPCKGVKTPTVPPVPLTIVTPGQFDAIYQALPDAGAQLLIETAIETGLRWGNSLNCGHGT